MDVEALEGGNAVPGLPDWQTALCATAGIWLVAAAAAAFNCLVEQRIDAKMARTAWRPTAKGELTNTQTIRDVILFPLLRPGPKE